MRRAVGVCVCLAVRGESADGCADRHRPRRTSTRSRRTGDTPRRRSRIREARTASGCHNDRAHDRQPVARAVRSREPRRPHRHGEKVVRKLRTGMMPPENAPKPSAAVREAFASALEGQLDRVAALHPDPGTPTLHRLNRAEYANAIRDLLALDVDVTAMLPPDDSAAGSTTTPTCSASRRRSSTATRRPPRRSAASPSAIRRLVSIVRPIACR